jgi:hypothetical protein
MEMQQDLQADVVGAYILTVADSALLPSALLPAALLADCVEASDSNKLLQCADQYAVQVMSGCSLQCHKEIKGQSSTPGQHRSLTLHQPTSCCTMQPWSRAGRQ